MKKQIALAVTTGLFSAFTTIGVTYAATTPSSQTNELSGHLGVALTMSSSAVGQEQQFLSNLIQKHGTAKGWESSKIQNQMSKVKSRFHKKGQEADLTTNLIGITVQIGNETATTDKSGNFDIDLAPGTYNVTLSDKGYKFGTPGTVTIKAGQKNFNITLNQAFNSLSTNMDKGMNMNNGMSMTKPMASMSMIKPMVSMSNTSSNLYTSQTISPQYIPSPFPYQLGQGNGVMTVYDADNHVSCNKSWNDEGAGFFPHPVTNPGETNNSDCANSTGYGIIFESTGNSDYWDNQWCFIEGMNKVFDDYTGEVSSNAYCNGTKNTGQKPASDWVRGGVNVGFNCSSFPDINDTEALNHY